MASDERGGGRGYEDDGAGNFDRFTDAVEGGDSLDDVSAKHASECISSMPEMSLAMAASMLKRRVALEMTEG